MKTFESLLPLSGWYNQLSSPRPSLWTCIALIEYAIIKTQLVPLSDCKVAALDLSQALHQIPLVEPTAAIQHIPLGSSS